MGSFKIALGWFCYKYSFPLTLALSHFACLAIGLPIPTEIPGLEQIVTIISNITIADLLHINYYDGGYDRRDSSHLDVDVIAQAGIQPFYYNDYDGVITPPTAQQVLAPIIRTTPSTVPAAASSSIRTILNRILPNTSPALNIPAPSSATSRRFLNNLVQIRSHVVANYDYGPIDYGFLEDGELLKPESYSYVDVYYNK
jgi:hypothetical protein